MNITMGLKNIKYSDLAHGMVIFPDDGFGCLPAYMPCIVYYDGNQRDYFVDCTTGKHYLKANDNGEYLIGIYVLDKIEPVKSNEPTQKPKLVDELRALHPTIDVRPVIKNMISILKQVASNGEKSYVFCLENNIDLTSIEDNYPRNYKEIIQYFINEGFVVDTWKNVFGMSSIRLSWE